MAFRFRCPNRREHAHRESAQKSGPALGRRFDVLDDVSLTTMSTGTVSRCGARGCSSIAKGSKNRSAGLSIRLAIASRSAGQSA